MKVKIEITGQVDETEQLQKQIDQILQQHFKSFKLIWELNRGLNE
jgi:hypothetical protein